MPNCKVWNDIVPRRNFDDYVILHVFGLALGLSYQCLGIALDHKRLRRCSLSHSQEARTLNTSVDLVAFCLTLVQSLAPY